MTEKTMTTMRFGDRVRRMIDILCVEEIDSMNAVIERAVEFYYQGTSVQRLKEMIYEFNGRIGEPTNLVAVLSDGNISGAIGIINSYKPRVKGVEKKLLEEIETRVKLIGA